MHFAERGKKIDHKDAPPIKVCLARNFTRCNRTQSFTLQFDSNGTCYGFFAITNINRNTSNRSDVIEKSRLTVSKLRYMRLSQAQQKVRNGRIRCRIFLNEVYVWYLVSTTWKPKHNQAGASKVGAISNAQTAQSF